jgi:hypothetical protein
MDVFVYRHEIDYNNSFNKYVWGTNSLLSVVLGSMQDLITREIYRKWEMGKILEIVDKQV